MRKPDTDRLLAGVALRLLDLQEPTALRWEEAAPGALRSALARRYRALVGIDPSQRGEYREALARLREEGDMTVAQLREDFGRQASGLSSL